MTLSDWAAKWGIPKEAVNDLRAQFNTAWDQPPINTELKFNSEAANSQKRRVLAALNGGRLWRNNVGALQDINGRTVRYGLANDSKKVNKNIKSSDLIGITPILVTPVHIGHTLGVFTSEEVKKDGWVYSGTDREQAQLKWLKLVASLGGIAKFTRGET